MLEGKQHVLETINATVSHEMRNPIQSILVMNLKLNEISELLQDIVNSTETDAKVIKEQIKVIIHEQKECCNIQQSSTKLLNYFVNDILSFAQLESGKFRHDLSTFCIKDSIGEILQIMKFKTQANGIKQ